MKHTEFAVADRKAFLICELPSNSAPDQHLAPIHSSEGRSQHQGNASYVLSWFASSIYTTFMRICVLGDDKQSDLHKPMEKHMQASGKSHAYAGTVAVRNP